MGGGEIPMWKREMLAKKAAEKAKKEAIDRRAQEQEYRKMVEIPAWKRQLIENRKADDPKRYSRQIDILEEDREDSSKNSIDKDRNTNENNNVEGQENLNNSNTPPCVPERSTTNDEKRIGSPIMSQHL